MAQILSQSAGSMWASRRAGATGERTAVSPVKPRQGWRPPEHCASPSRCRQDAADQCGSQHLVGGGGSGAAARIRRSLPKSRSLTEPWRPPGLARHRPGSPGRDGGDCDAGLQPRNLQHAFSAAAAAIGGSQTAGQLPEFRQSSDSGSPRRHPAQACAADEASDPSTWASALQVRMGSGYSLTSLQSLPIPFTQCTCFTLICTVHGFELILISPIIEPQHLTCNSSLLTNRQAIYSCRRHSLRGSRWTPCCEGAQPSRRCRLKATVRRRQWAIVRGSIAAHEPKAASQPTAPPAYLRRKNHMTHR